MRRECFYHDFCHVTLKRKKKSRNGGKLNSSGGESGDTTKSARSYQSPRVENQISEWKVTIVFVEQFYLVTVANALEKDVGRVKHVKYLNNKQILVHTVRKEQQDVLLKMNTLDGKNTCLSG